MPDTPFKSMGPDPTSQTEGRYTRKAVKCERCAGIIYQGDWPWCSGNPKDHERS